ncbi:MAG: hypothetical protein K1X75_04695 [Leptospirales bacterium]|nr:hypothetical protein [Leptospirales bacterium]
MTTKLLQAPGNQRLWRLFLKALVQTLDVVDGIALHGLSFSLILVSYQEWWRLRQEIDCVFLVIWYELFDYNIRMQTLVGPWLN